MKKLLALLLAALMLVSVLPVAAFADDSTPAGAPDPEWPAQGSILLDKTAAAVSGETNMWEVTLKIQGKNYKTTSDVVLVIDNSNSMYTKKTDKNNNAYYVEDSNSRMTKTKTAAKAFADKLLTKDSGERIAVVVYNKTEVHTSFYDYNTKEQLKTYIGNIKPASNKYNGGTFTQLGIHTARTILASAESTGVNKNIVLLSDGIPTYSYLLTGTSSWKNCRQTENWGHWWTGSVDESAMVVTGCNYNSIQGSGYEKSDSNYTSGRINLAVTCEHGEHRTENNYSIEHTVPTIWEAQQATAEGTTVYAIAFQAGTEGTNALKACATDETKGFFSISNNETDVEGKLKTAFESVASAIAIAAKNGVVSDTMGPKVQLVFDGTPTFTNDLAVYNAGNADVYYSQGSAPTYNTSTETFNWSVGDVREGDVVILKYKVTLKADAVVQTGELVDTNTIATFSYKDYLQRDRTKEFPKPKVTIGGGNILVKYYLVNSNGQPINSSGTVVASPEYAMKVQADTTVSTTHNVATTVSKATISGFNYYGSYILDDGALTVGDSVGITTTAQDSDHTVWFAYTRSFTVVHIQEGEEVARESHDVVDGFDITAETTNGYLYGGTFSDEDCTTVADFNNGNPTEFTPEAGEVYYIWEVDKAYLTPKAMSGWHSVEAGVYDANGFYLVTPIDRLLYREVGFIVSSSKNATPATFSANQLETHNFEDGSTTLQYVDGSVVYETITAKLKDGSAPVYDITTYLGSDYEGYLACYRLQKTGYWEEKDDTVTYVPYWITLDGVKVTGAKERTCKYEGEGTEAKNKLLGLVSEETVASTVEYIGEANANIESLMLASVFVTDASLFNDEQQPTDPVDPIEPVDPVDPIEPEEPEVSVEDNEIVITVHDAGNTYTVYAEPGDLRDEIEYIGEAGKLFAGWYTDERFRNAESLENVTESIEIYAKYVSDTYLQVKYIENTFFRKHNVYLITAVESKDFAEVGFVINEETLVAGSSGRKVPYSAASLFGRSISRNACLMLAEYSLDGVDEGAELVVIPYWVTADGTTVYGTQRTLTMAWYGLEG